MFHSLIIIFTLLPILSVSQNGQQFTDCSTNLYSCGETIRWIGYPFWGNTRPSYCGLNQLHLNCQEDSITTLQIHNTTFRVLQIHEEDSRITLAQNDPNICSIRQQESVSNTTFEHSVFTPVSSGILFLNLYLSCFGDDVSIIPVRNRLNCSGVESGRVSFFGDGVNSLGCESVIRVPVSRQVFDEFNQSETMRFEEVLTQGFEMEYRVDGDGICSRCESSGGTCWSGFNSSVSPCLCPGGIPQAVCGSASGARGNLKVKLIIGLMSAALSAMLVFVTYCIMKSSSRNCVPSFEHKTEDDNTVEAFIKEYGSLSTQRYKYIDIKKMTNSFKFKLGQGGFGTVYNGKLLDGRLVAVKVLNTSKASGQEFINEVASIGRTSHVNIVTLLGFCFEHKKRALVYELMPNGSLEKFLHSNDSTNMSTRIGVDKLYDIALGIARGLDYLHRGCNTRILHLDIKPHNILLDEDFCPKIADFGLAKLYSRKESMVSMLEARGTIGYIAPEVFNRNFGGVSHKSDVYSYGMLVLEMVGGRKNVDVGVGSGHTSEIYFPYWIYSRLKKDEYLLDSVTNAQENDYARKMTIVGLWCIQVDPKKRPSINEVIEMLEGSTEELDIPPKPCFSSPPRSPVSTFNASESEIASL